MWEYQVHRWPIDLLGGLRSSLNAEGNAGWELVTVLQDSSGATFIFKRAKA